MIQEDMQMVPLISDQSEHMRDKSRLQDML
jgi:hypothetical protein